METFDVIIVGAGYAGVTAARELREQNRSVLVLEARDRIGGRTYKRPFAGEDSIAIEGGGAYLNPEIQHNLRREIERYAIPVVPAEGAIDTVRFIGRDGGARSLPVPVEQLESFEQAIVHTAVAARRIDASRPLADQDVADLDVSIESFYGPVLLPRETEALIAGLVGGYWVADPTAMSMLQTLSLTAACGGSPYGAMIGVFDTKFANGTGDLIAAMVGDSDPDLSLGSPVAVVDDLGHKVRVQTEKGDTYAAGCCIVAVPAAVYESIELRPGLSARKREALGGAPSSQGAKRFFIVEGAPSGFFGLAETDAPTPLQWLFEDAALPDGRSLLVGFATDPDFGTADLDETQDAVRAFIPEAKVVATDLEDWARDPYARAICRVSPPGLAHQFARTMTEPDGRVILAGSDVSASHFAAGFIEGAIESGTSAARQADVLTTI